MVWPTVGSRTAKEQEQNNKESIKKDSGAGAMALGSTVRRVVYLSGTDECETFATPHLPLPKKTTIADI